MGIAHLRSFLFDSFSSAAQGVAAGGFLPALYSKSPSTNSSASNTSMSSIFSPVPT